MSAYAEKVKGYYELGLWNDNRVRNAVVKGAFTEEEYEAITGKELLAE